MGNIGPNYQASLAGVPSRLLAPPASVRPGRLVIVGSGVKSIAHMTLETVSHLQTADKVFYCVADPVTELYIQKLNPNSTDLHRYYGNGKIRTITYVQMAEVMLREVRQGFYVVGCFYGHPGVFAHPTHRALSIARNEGYEATMLPGISAEDCLFADLNIDPSRPGCQILGATDLVYRERPLALDCHVILFQVGAFGESGFSFKGLDRSKLPLLIDRLLNDYGPEHTVIDYVASTLSFVESQCKTYKIKDFKDPEVLKTITGVSTFYLPPKIRRPVSESGAKLLGFSSDPNGRHISSTLFFPLGQPYGPIEMSAIKALDNHQIPEDYRKTRASPELFEALCKLEIDPKAVRRYRDSPNHFVSSLTGLTDEEHLALVSGRRGWIRRILKADAVQISKRFVQTVLLDPTLAIQYSAVASQNQEHTDGKTRLALWLKNKGYDITVEDVATAYQKMANEDLAIYEFQYDTILDGIPGPVILLKHSEVKVDGVAIKNASFTSQTLSWTVEDGNESSARLQFQSTGALSTSLLADDAYEGPYFRGVFCQKDREAVNSFNILGRVGLPTGHDPAAPIPVSTWNGSYQTYLKDRNDNFQENGLLAVTVNNFKELEVTYNNVELKNTNYRNGVLSWALKGSNAGYGSLSFFQLPSTSSESNETNYQCIGKIWNADGQVPLEPNFWGRIKPSADPSADSALTYEALGAKIKAANQSFGVSSIIAAQAIAKVIDATVKKDQAPGESHKSTFDGLKAEAKAAMIRSQAIHNEVAQAQGAIFYDRDAHDELEALENGWDIDDIEIDDDQPDQEQDDLLLGQEGKQYEELSGQS